MNMLRKLSKIVTVAIAATVLHSGPSWALNAGSTGGFDNLPFGNCTLHTQMQPLGAGYADVWVQGGNSGTVRVDNYFPGGGGAFPTGDTALDMEAALDGCGAGGTVSNVTMDGANGTFATDNYVGFAFTHTKDNGAVDTYDVSIRAQPASASDINIIYVPGTPVLAVDILSNPSISVVNPGTVFTVSIQFNDSVTDFDLTDITVTNGSVDTFTAGPGSNEFTVNIQVDPTVSTGDDVLVELPVTTSSAQGPGGVFYPSGFFSIGVKGSGTGGNALTDETEAAIATYMLARADQLAVNQPDLIRFLQGEQCGALNASATENGQNIDGCISRGNTWAELTAAWADDSEFTLATIGTHRAINPNLIIGGMLQFDHASGAADASLGHAEISGHGWMVGPYFAAQLRDQPIYFEGRLLYGQSDNEITVTPNFGSSFTDNFQTERMLAQLRVMGEYKLQNTTLMPLFDFTYMDDTQDRYVDSQGNTIDGQTVGLTQLIAGLDFSRPIEVQSGNFTLNGGLSGIYSASHGTAADREIVRGRVDLGFVYDLENNGTLSASTFLDGIGADTQSRGLSLTFDMTF